MSGHSGLSCLTSIFPSLSRVSRSRLFLGAINESSILKPPTAISAPSSTASLMHFGFGLSPRLCWFAAMPRGQFTPQRHWRVFRDLVAISVIPLNRSWDLQHGPQHRILWSDTFAFYPWTLDKNNNYLVAQTPALFGLHLVEEFRGQSAPELPSRLPLDRLSIDEPLLASLMERWRRRYVTATPDINERKLFRSLNMANQASRIPAGTDATFYDVGRSIALWISAFEILAHSGKGGRSGPLEVVKLLNRIPWLRSRLRASRIQHRRKRTKGRLSSVALWADLSSPQRLSSRQSSYRTGPPD